jgi:hypothetical protein
VRSSTSGVTPALDGSCLPGWKCLGVSRRGWVVGV